VEKARHTLLELVRSSLWERPATGLPEEVDWAKVYTLARQQTLLGLLADAVRRLPQERKPDTEMVQKLQVFCMRNIQSHMLITNRLAGSLEILRSAGVEPVLFKGHGLAINYPDPMSRQCGDIDLYVGKKDYDKAVQACRQAFEEDEHDSESIKHFHFNNGGVSVEIHRIAETIPGIFQNRRYQRWTVESLQPSALRKTDIEGVTVSLPPHNFNAVYVMNHAWHHFVTGGVGLRQFCDWTVYMHKFGKEIDVQQLEKDLRSFGLLKVWKIFACVAVNFLGFPEDECPLYDAGAKSSAEKAMEIVWTDGNFGRYSERSSKRPEGYSSGKIHSMIVTTKRYFRILPVYPSHILSAWVLYFFNGIYHYCKGLFE